MSDQVLRTFYEKNPSAETPPQGSVNNDLRIRAEVAKASVSKT